MKNLLKMSDLSPAELTHILDVADQLKADCKAGRTAPLLAGKSVALLFSKASTRTRTSFEVGVYQMGGLGNYMNTAELQAGRGEPLRDTARVLGRYYDCAVWRTYRQRDLEELAELSGIPVINGLTDYAHPCQVLADLMTIRERRGTLAGLKLCFVGDGSNMANSLIVGGLLAGMQVSCVCPPGYRPAADVLMFAHKYGNAFHLTTDPAEGLRDADIVATAAWNTTAPGTAESEQRLRDFVGFQLTGRLLENAKPDALVLHCLPAHRGEEISTALFEQHADEIFDEAENRLHVQKAVLAVLLLMPDELILPEPEFDLPQAVSNSAAATTPLQSAVCFSFICYAPLSIRPDQAEAFGESLPGGSQEYSWFRIQPNHIRGLSRRSTLSSRVPSRLVRQSESCTSRHLRRVLRASSRRARIWLLR